MADGCLGVGLAINVEDFHAQLDFDILRPFTQLLHHGQQALGQLLLDLRRASAQQRQLHMHERTLAQAGADFKGLDLNGAALDIELRRKLTGSHQRIVEPYERHVGVQLGQVGGVFHVQMRHDGAPWSWQKGPTYNTEPPYSQAAFNAPVRPGIRAARWFPKPPPTSPLPWSARPAPTPKTDDSTPAAAARATIPDRPNGTTAAIADQP